TRSATSEEHFHGAALPPAPREELPADLPPFDGKPRPWRTGVAATLAAPDAVCARVPTSPVRSQPGARCDDRSGALLLLHGAMTESDAIARDRELAELESCAGLPAGFVRALRADLLPACAEPLAAPVLLHPPAGISAELFEALRGLALANRIQ